MDGRRPAGAAAVSAAPVRVGIRAEVPVPAAWAALTDPARVGEWFGDLDAPWQPGRTGRIEFGDGDFFVVTAREVREPELVRFDWSFLGVGPPQRIEWWVRPTATGVEVVVEDHDLARAPAEVEQMRAGWTDFFTRLAGYLATGQPTRYDWRGEIDGSVDLPGRPALLDPAVMYRWLPVASDGFRPRWFFVVDQEGPRRFEIEDWQQQPDGATLTFSVLVPQAVAATRCRVAIEGSARGGRLRVSHTGWRELGLPDGDSRRLRGRFAAAWTAALDAARELAQISPA